MIPRIYIYLSLTILFASAWYFSHEINHKNTVPAADQVNSSLVQFEDEAAKQGFLEENHISTNDLKPTKGNNYVVPKKPAQIKSINGTKTYPNYTYKALLTPNESGNGLYPQWYTDKISAPNAWDITTGNSSVTVAVIDTGFGLGHEDMQGRWAENLSEKGTTINEGPAPNCTSRTLTLDKSCNNLDDDSNGFIDDWRGWDFVNNDNDPQPSTTTPTGCDGGDYRHHGTITSGLVGATGNNNKGIASINWAVKILPLQVLADNGCGFSSDVADAIDYAVARGAKVISLSLGQPDYDQYMRDRINAAVSAGAIVIAAAGNSGTSSCGCMAYPGNFPEVVAVGATDWNDVRSNFYGSSVASSYGPNLDIMAPGVSNPTNPLRTTNWSPGNQTTGYTVYANGTSIATPIVAGIAASIISISPDIRPNEIEDLISRSSDRVAGMGGSDRSIFYGRGRVNAANALKWADTTHPDGSLVVLENKVFLIEEGKRRHLLTPTIFLSYKYRWADIKNATRLDRLLTEGPPVSSIRPGTLIASGPEVYVAVTEDGVSKKSHMSYSAFTALGYSTRDILRVPSNEMPDITGATIWSSPTHPRGTFVKSSGPDVFLIDQGNRRYVPSPPIFLSSGFDWADIKPATQSDLSLPVSAQELTYREGSLVLFENKIYTIDLDTAGLARSSHIPNWGCFDRNLILKIEQVFLIDPALPPIFNPINC